MTSMATNLDARAKQYQQASKGFDNLTETSEFIDKFDLSWDDFEFQDGKWYLK
jgi:hypothetical protein